MLTKILKTQLPYMMIEGDWKLGGEHTMQHIDDVL